MLKISPDIFFAELSDSYAASELSAMWRLLDEESNLPDDLLVRLKEREPLQYILGYTWFYKRKFQVSPATLIPRPETEELCDIVLHDKQTVKNKILDVGTGSGCIAITVCAETPNAHAVAMDVSEDALDMARRNTAAHYLSDRIEFRQMDFLAEPQNAGSDFDLIISNPPYISIEEKADLEDNVVQWEPHLALFPPGEDALIFYRALNTLLECQNGKSTLYAEINSLHPQATMEIFGAFPNRELITDWSGNPRFIRIKKEG